jgi:hypothetical protein
MLETGLSVFDDSYDGSDNSSRYFGKSFDEFLSGPLIASGIGNRAMASSF